MPKITAQNSDSMEHFEYLKVTTYAIDLIIDNSSCPKSDKCNVDYWIVSMRATILYIKLRFSGGSYELL